MAQGGRGGSATIIHKVVLGLFAALDLGLAAWLLTHDVTRLAFRRGLSVDGTIVACMVAYLVALAAINVFGIVRVASVSDRERAMRLRESRLTGMGEMILFAGVLMILVGVLILAPGVMAWLILLALALIAAGGILAAVGLNRSVLKAAIVAEARKRRDEQSASQQTQA